jgi:hypothetical protein
MKTTATKKLSKSEAHSRTGSSRWYHRTNGAIGPTMTLVNAVKETKIACIIQIAKFRMKDTH